MTPPLSIPQAVAAARAAGFRGEALVTIVAIATAESGLNPAARNINADPQRSVDRGILQINSHWHPEITDQCADTPQCAFAAGWTISKQGTDFTPWSTFVAGAHQKFMPQVRAALGTLEPPSHPTALPPHPWAVELSPWPYGWNQRKDWTADGRTDENALRNCGPESVAECVKYLTDVELPADYIHDLEIGEAKIGDTSFADHQLFLRKYCNVDSVIHAVDARTPFLDPAGHISAPVVELLSAIRHNLSMGHPMIGLFSFSHPNAPDGHFRPITGMTGKTPWPAADSTIITSDPWTGTRRVETYESFWAWSKGSILHLRRKRGVLA